MSTFVIATKEIECCRVENFHWPEIENTLDEQLVCKYWCCSFNRLLQYWNNLDQHNHLETNIEWSLVNRRLRIISLDQNIAREHHHRLERRTAWRRSSSSCWNVTCDRSFDIDHGLLLSQEFSSIFDNLQCDFFTDSTFTNEMGFENVDTGFATRIKDFIDT